MTRLRELSRFLVVFAVTVAVAYLSFTGVQQSRERSATDRRVDQLVELTREQRAGNVEARQEASRQRDELLATQRELLHQLAAVADEQRQLRRYLADHGIDVPADLSSSTSSSSTSTDPRHNPRPPAKPRPRIPMTRPSTTDPAAPTHSAPTPAQQLDQLLGQLLGPLTP